MGSGPTAFFSDVIRILSGPGSGAFKSGPRANGRFGSSLTAASASFSRYFSLFAADGVFIGTDAGERWTVDQFKAYAKPYFDKGQGWTYTRVERHVNVSADGGHASFDELLDNAGLGRCRGTGVLRRVAGEWKIEQYHLTIPVPNALAADLAARIRADR